jgi:hypothetical protein
MSDSRRSAACAIDKHELCPHLTGLRLTGEPVCRCRCHSKCALADAGTVQLSIWWNSCDCTGSERLRSEGRRLWARDTPPDLTELRQKMRDEERARSEVRESIEARSAGLSRGELRDLFMGELLSRGYEIPPDSVLDREIDLMRLAIPRDAGIFTMTKWLIRSVMQARSTARDLAAARGESHTIQGPRGEPPYVVMADLSLPMVAVTLDPQASSVITRKDRGVFIALDRHDSDGPDAVVAYLANDRIGVLAKHDGEIYYPAIKAARQAGRILIVQGKSSWTPDASPEIRIYAAGVL